MIKKLHYKNSPDYIIEYLKSQGFKVKIYKIKHILNIDVELFSHLKIHKLLIFWAYQTLC